MTFERPGDVVRFDTLSVSPAPGCSIKHFDACDPKAKWTVARSYGRPPRKTPPASSAPVLAAMPHPIEAIQIDGGPEFMAE
ncbi:MAG: hypothetical protein ACREDM_16225, partial [Methylocella sp.]